MFGHWLVIYFIKRNKSPDVEKYAFCHIVYSMGYKGLNIIWTCYPDDMGASWTSGEVQGLIHTGAQLCP